MRTNTAIAWLPSVTLPLAAALLIPDDWPRWAFMWLFAWTIFMGCKWLTWWSTAATGVLIGRHMAYFAAWPGLDADAFLGHSAPRTLAWSSWLFALAKLAFGLALVFAVYPMVPREWILARGWVGMIGIIFVLHFGLFDLLSHAWRAYGVDARPIMDWPMLAVSISDFWGQRWNLAFRDLTHRFLFRPLTIRYGARAALVAVFLFSGIVHDLVISLPARGGWGGPTAYFLLQACAIFFERSALGQRLGLTHGLRGWAFTMAVLLGPLGLLFHPPFVGEVVVPLVDWLNQWASVGA